VLAEDGTISPDLFKAISFIPYTKNYMTLGDVAGKAFSDRRR
jgi:hypothetical protein